MTINDRDNPTPAPIVGGNLRHEYDPIAGKMRYYGSSAPDGWLGDDVQRTAPGREELVELLAHVDRLGIKNSAAYERAIQDLRSAICFAPADGATE